jgi:hypothetical protein
VRTSTCAFCKMHARPCRVICASQGQQLRSLPGGGQVQ